MPDLDRKELRLATSTAIFFISIFAYYIFTTTPLFDSDFSGDVSKKLAFTIATLGATTISFLVMIFTFRDMAKDNPDIFTVEGIKESMTEEKRTGTDIITGILLILSGIIVLIIHLKVINSFSNIDFTFFNQWLICNTMSIIFGLTALISGVYTLFKDDWFIPVLGGICAILSLSIHQWPWGWWLF